VRKTRYIVLGFAIGIIGEIGSLILAYSGTNLFHGGHPNDIVNALLPGLGIVDHLSDHVPPFIPKFLLVTSLFQFPVYGALAGRDLANKAFSKIAIGIVLLHLSSSGLALYGMALDRQWQMDAAKYGSCILENAAAQEVANNSAQINRLVQWMSQSREQLKRLQTEKGNGAIFAPDPEPSLVKDLENQQRELDQRWKFYQDAGGPAKAPEEVSVIPSPCGKPPSKPTIF